MATETKLDYLEGTVEKINKAGTGLMIQGNWYNYSDYKKVPYDEHGVGSWVTLGLDGKWIMTLETVQRGHGTVTESQRPAPQGKGNGTEPMREPSAEPYRDPTRASIERQTALKVAGEIVVAGLNKGVIEDMHDAGDWLARLAKLGADTLGVE